MDRGHVSLEQIDRRYRELNTKLQGGQYTRDEWSEHFELGKDLVAIKSKWEPTFWASLSFVGTGVVSGFLGLGAHDSSERLKLGRNSGDSLKLLMEIWQRISTASGARAKQKREEAGRALNDLDKSIRESVTQLFALLDDDFATVVWAYGQDKTAEGYTSNRFVLIPSFVAGSVGLSPSSFDQERLSTLVNEWPEGLPRLEMEVGYRSDTDIVFGEIILVHPKSSGANREVLLRVKVDGTSEVEKTSLKYRPYTAALQSAPLRSALKQDELRNVVVSDLSNTFQGLLIQMALARETGRGQASELRQRLGERSLPPGTGVPIRLGQQGQLEIGEAPEPLPAWRQGTQEAK